MRKRNSPLKIDISITRHRKYVNDLPVMLLTDRKKCMNPISGHAYIFAKTVYILPGFEIFGSPVCYISGANT